MTSRLLRLGLLSVMAAALHEPALAQFGQNKITYNRFEWQIYPSPHFDIHYYGATETFLDDIVSHAESAYLRISKDLDHELRFRVPLILYKTHAEFEQTNITMGRIPEEVGAFAEPVQNRMVLPIDQPPDKLYALIAHELTHIFQYSILFEGNLGRALRSNTPTWLVEGMASYLAKDEDNVDRMVIRDAVVNNILPPIERLDVVAFLTYRYGHAIFDFIEQEFGQEGMRNFLFEYRRVLLGNNVMKAMKEAFGVDPEEFNRRFNRYLRKKYLPVLLEKKNPEDYGLEIGVKKEGVFTFSPTISPSGELVAALASPKMELDLLVLSAEDGSTIRNLTRGWTNRYEHVVAEAFDGKRDLSWSPAGDEVAVFVRREAVRPLRIYRTRTGKLSLELVFPDMAECASPSFSPDGRRVAFEANRNGIVDIFEVALDSGEVRNLTQDDFFDANPWYAADGKTLLYNRRIGAHWKIFSVDLADPTRKTQLSFGPSSDIQPSYSRDGKAIWFSSDRGAYGVFNIHALDVASGEIRQYTDVVGGCFSPAEMAERNGEPYVVFSTFFEGTFRLFRMPVRQPESRTAATESTASPVDASPFEPPLRLTADTAKISPYRLRWDIDAPSIAVGVTDDGTFLSNVALQFSDLLGDHRVQVLAYSVADFANFDVTYLNLKRRIQWGARLYDFRDYFTTFQYGTVERDQIQRSTGLDTFLQYPFSRLYRVEAGVGVLDRSQDYLVGVDEATLLPVFQRVNERFGMFNASLVGDSTRYQSFGPFQGKRFSVGTTYGLDLGSDIGGDLLLYTLDFRAYKQATRRSVLAWRLAGLYNAGVRDTYFSLGGVNQLRGYGFRDYFGSRVVWSNLEFRFPLIDEMRFPILALLDLRGFFFLDVGGAWFQDGSFFDPELGAYGAVPVNLSTGRPIQYEFWDSSNDRLQDGRGAYGFGFQFFFLGGLQFNWVWSQRLPYNSYVLVQDDLGNLALESREADRGGRRMDFYIVFDF